MFLAVLVVSLFAGVPLSNAWGTDGHYMVCKIAQSYLTSTASSAVLKLLPSSANGNLASMCSWADNVRTSYPWSSALHYIDTPDNLCTYSYSNNLTQALMFLSHFMGDVHQPLHVGFTTDAGGNGITVYCFASESIQQACSYAYKDAPNGAYLSDTYYLSRKSVVNTRIAQGGVRLANFLNQIFV
ncbi:hypothetical protein LUZ61_007771 [Rhynchospora tenuis]|uniref:Aspergillus nuclease S1 n=1 Tax=Rhynchospora tenuis TaxID=198213 RepID=A0AAD6EWU9_9POAL|nr:hypothetical protein LUZ61_007771 [Rhynchospora tenuis]